MKVPIRCKGFQLMALVMMVLVMGCSKEVPATPNEKTEQLLRSTMWTLTSLKIDNVNSSRYAGMTLSFGNGVYNSAGGDPVWPVSGTWAWEGQGGNRIRRNDGLLIDILGASASQITMSFDWTETTYELGRIVSSAGRHEMVFARK